MPVHKFRSVEEMKQPRRRQPGDPELYRAIRAVWEFGARVRPRRFPPGVYKHASIEEAKAMRQRWEDDHVASLRAQHAHRP